MLHFSRNDSLRVWLGLFLGLILIGLGWLLVNQSGQINTTPSFGDNVFRIGTISPTISELDDNNIFYDFESNKGNISTTITSRKNNLSRQGLVIKVPPKLQLMNVSLLENGMILIKGKDYYVTEDKKSSVRMNFSSSFKAKKVQLNADIRGDLTPNGIFEFNFLAYKVYESKPEIITFELGKFKCDSLCIQNPRNTKISNINNTLVVAQPDDYYTDVTEYKSLSMEFTLATYDAEKIEKKERKNAIGISLFVAGIIFALQQALKLLFLRKRITKKKT
jgi:hypothetical protein